MQCYADRMSTPPRAFLPGSDDREDEDTIEIQLSPAQYETLVRAAEQVACDTPASAVELVTPQGKEAAPAANSEALPVESAAAAAKTDALARKDSPAAARIPTPKDPTPADTRTLPAPQPAGISVPPPMPPPLAASIRSVGRTYLTATGVAILLAVSVTIAYQLGARARSVTPLESPPPVRVTAPVRDTTPAAPPTPPPAFIEEAKSEPVRFKNPFDANEVFEFPPGTSDAEARDAVASLLIRRAQERRTPQPHPRPDDPSFARRT